MQIEIAPLVPWRNCLDLPLNLSRTYAFEAARSLPTIPTPSRRQISVCSHTITLRSPRSPIVLVANRRLRVQVASVLQRQLQVRVADDADADLESVGKRVGRGGSRVNTGRAHL